MAQRNYWERGANAYFSLGFFSFFRGGGTGASVLAPSFSFLITFLITFFLGASVASGVFGLGSVFAETEDSIKAAVEGFGLTPIWASETESTGGEGASGSWTERRERGAAGTRPGAGAGV